MISESLPSRVPTRIVALVLLLAAGGCVLFARSKHQESARIYDAANWHTFKGELTSSKATCIKGSCTVGVKWKEGEKPRSGTAVVKPHIVEGRREKTIHTLTEGQRELVCVADDFDECRGQHANRYFAFFIGVGAVFLIAASIYAFFRKPQS